MRTTARSRFIDAPYQRLVSSPEMHAFHIRGGRLIDPRQGVDDELDVIVQDGRIARIGKGLDTPTGALVCDARGKIVAPGFVDLHAHLREPGEEGKETIESGSNAAAS